MEEEKLLKYAKQFNAMQTVFYMPYREGSFYDEHDVKVGNYLGYDASKNCYIILNCGELHSKKDPESLDDLEIIEAHRVFGDSIAAAEYAYQSTKNIEDFDKIIPKLKSGTKLKITDRDGTTFFAEFEELKEWEGMNCCGILCRKDGRVLFLENNIIDTMRVEIIGEDYDN